MLQFHLDHLPEGRRLRVARLVAGFTLWELAQRANVQPPRISEFERGQGQLSAEALERIRAVLIEQLTTVGAEMRHTGNGPPDAAEGASTA